MSDQLENLKKRFNPHRTYKSGNTMLEVDGVFVRIDDDMTYDNDSVLMPLEDLLQDPAVIRSARVSTGRDTAVVNEKAAGLIGSLYKGNHVTPFEGSVIFRLRCELPIYTAQPFFQLPYSHNEWSGRYSEIDGDFAVPDSAYQNPAALQIFREAEADSRAVYKEFLAAGIAKEHARFALLYRFFTKFYWTVSLRHLLRVASLEESALAPPDFWEARDNIIVPMIKNWTPWTYDKFLEHKKIIPTKWALEQPMSSINDWIRLARVENLGHVRLISEMVSASLTRLGVHTGPDPFRGLGHNNLSFEIVCPIFVHRQWVRHRYSVWSELPIDFDKIVHDTNFYIPNAFRKQVGKAMSYEFEDMVGVENDQYREKLARLIQRNMKRYTLLRDMGLSAQEAGVTLPYVFRVRRLWTVNFESLMNFFSLRCDMHAQWEVRQYANTIYQWFMMRYPWANELFLEYANYGSSPLFDPKQ